MSTHVNRVTSELFRISVKLHRALRPSVRLLDGVWHLFVRTGQFADCSFFYRNHTFGDYLMADFFGHIWADISADESANWLIPNRSVTIQFFVVYCVNFRMRTKVVTEEGYRTNWRSSVSSPRCSLKVLSENWDLAFTVCECLSANRPVTVWNLALLARQNVLSFYGKLPTTWRATCFCAIFSDATAPHACKYSRERGDFHSCRLGCFLSTS